MNGEPYTEKQVRDAITLIVGWCEREHGNGLNPPIDAVLSAVHRGDDLSPIRGAGGHALANRVDEIVDPSGAAKSRREATEAWG